MDSLQITTGEKRIPIVRDGQNVGEIVFNPSDVLFAERFYKLIGEFDTRFAEYQEKAKTLVAVTEKDKHDFPINTDAQIELTKEVCVYIKERIDILFGAGTSQIVFGDVLNVDMFGDFFTGIQPHIQKARSEKIAQYTTVTSAKRNKRKMK